MGSRGAYMHHVPKSVTMIMTMIITPKTDKPAFRQLQNETLNYMKQQGRVSLKNDNLYSKRLYYGSDEMKNIVKHCFDNEELNVAKNLHKILPKLKNGKYDPINTKRANYKIKMREKKFRNYVRYEFEYEGKSYELKCAAIRSKRSRHGYIIEHPYSLKKVKEK